MDLEGEKEWYYMQDYVIYTDGFPALNDGGEF